MPCFNRAQDLIKTLRAYDKQSGDDPFEVIAVDDCSKDETYEVLRSYHPERYSLVTVRQEKNQGPAAARNRGMALAQAPLILFVGDDIVPDPHLVHSHIVAHRYHKEEEIAILGRVAWPGDLPTNTLMKHIDGVGAQQFSYHFLREGQEYDFRHLYTANISLKREFLFSVGKGFDTDFPFAAFEDVEFAYRLSQRGLRIIYSSLPLGYHYHYHTIWTFSTRQYRAGLMACLLIDKHPEIKYKILGKRWRLRTLNWRLLAILNKYPPVNIQSLEDRAQYLSSSYEWMPHPLLNRLYMGILSYFYVKGLIYGSFGQTSLARHIHNVYTHRSLVPLLAKLSLQESYQLQARLG